jgi:hypothetical protein
MPIAIDNRLSHISFDIGTDASVDPSLIGLKDACSALNTSHLRFHLWFKSKRTNLVTEFISFEDNANPFEPIKLLGGAVSNPSDFDSSAHGNLTAVIRCCTPCVNPFGAPFVTANTIFGLPVLCNLDAVISLRSNLMHSRALNLDFQLLVLPQILGCLRAVPSIPLVPPLAIMPVPVAFNLLPLQHVLLSLLPLQASPLLPTTCRSASFKERFILCHDLLILLSPSALLCLSLPSLLSLKPSNSIKISSCFLLVSSFTLCLLVLRTSNACS